MVLEHLQLFRRWPLPHSRRFVLTAVRDPRSIRTPADAGHYIAVPAKRLAYLRPCAYIEQPYVAGASRNTAAYREYGAVRPEGERKDRSGEMCNTSHRLARDSIPKRHGAVTADCQSFPIRTEGKCGYRR